MCFLALYNWIENVATGFSWKIANRKCHVTTALRSRLQFAVHVWTAGRASNGK